MELRLRDYQEEGVRFLVDKRRAILADDKGLGKTPQALVTLQRLGLPKTLIICNKPAIGVWRENAGRWLDVMAATYVGTPRIREEQWQLFVDYDLPIIVTNYTLMHELLRRRHWDAIICDEYHGYGLLNPKAESHKALRKAKTDVLLLLTGTPVRRNPADLWGPLHLIDPKRFPSYWQFVYKHCMVINDGLSKTIENKPKDVRGFNAMVREYMIHRTKKDHLPELPDKVREVVPLELEGKQKRLYNDIATEMLAIDGDTVVATPNKMTQILRLRQLLVTPRLLGFDAGSVALDALRGEARDNFDSGRPITVFCPFKQALPYIAEAVDNIDKKSTDIHFISGDLTAKKFEESWRAFQNSKNPRRALICVIKSATSFDAYAATEAYFIGYEWSANDCTQAEDRLHRMGQRNTVTVYYFLHPGTIDEAVMQKLDDKTMAASWILRPEEMLEAQRRVRDARGL